jgi:hypothetical protein
MKKNIFAICMVTAAGCMATLTAQTTDWKQIQEYFNEY